MGSQYPQWLPAEELIVHSKTLETPGQLNQQSPGPGVAGVQAYLHSEVQQVLLGTGDFVEPAFTTAIGPCASLLQHRPCTPSARPYKTLPILGLPFILPGQCFTLQVFG